MLKQIGSKITDVHVQIQLHEVFTTYAFLDCLSTSVASTYRALFVWPWNDCTYEHEQKNKRRLANGGKRAQLLVGLANTQSKATDWKLKPKIQRIDTLPKYGHKALDISYVYMTYIQRWR